MLPVFSGEILNLKGCRLPGSRMDWERYDLIKWIITWGSTTSRRRGIAIISKWAYAPLCHIVFTATFSQSDCCTSVSDEVASCLQYLWLRKKYVRMLAQKIWFVFYTHDLLTPSPAPRTDWVKHYDTTRQLFWQMAQGLSAPWSIMKPRLCQPASNITVWFLQVVACVGTL